MSFGFTSRQEEWDYSVDPPHRTIIEADLYEITYTALPGLSGHGGRPALARGCAQSAEERKNHNRQGWLERKADSEQRIRNDSGQPARGLGAQLSSAPIGRPSRRPFSLE
jgi:hypothetical protein